MSAIHPTAERCLICGHPKSEHGGPGEHVCPSNDVNGPPFTVDRYGSFGQCVIAERDWLQVQLLSMTQWLEANQPDVFSRGLRDGMHLARETKTERYLGDLLAIIHGDGGHYQAEHGDEKATADAIAKYYATRFDALCPHGMPLAENIKPECEHLRSELLAEKQTAGEPIFQMCRCLDCGKAFRVRSSLKSSPPQGSAQ